MSGSRYTPLRSTSIVLLILKTNYTSKISLTYCKNSLSRVIRCLRSVIARTSSLSSLWDYLWKIRSCPRLKYTVSTGRLKRHFQWSGRSSRISWSKREKIVDTKTNYRWSSSNLVTSLISLYWKLNRDLNSLMNPSAISLEKSILSPC